MEVTISEVQGFENDCILSMRLGTQRRQAPLGSKRLFNFTEVPSGAKQLHLDVYRPIASATVELSGSQDTRFVSFSRMPESTPKALTLKVKESSAAERPVSSASAATTIRDCFSTRWRPDSSRPCTGLQKSELASAQAYLEASGLIDILQRLLRDLLKERPEDCLLEISKRLQRLVVGRRQQDAMSEQEEEESPGVKRSSVMTAPKEEGAWRASHRDSFVHRRVVEQLPTEEAFPDDDELQVEPPTVLRRRGRGVSAEAYGAWNSRRAAFVPPNILKREDEREGLMAAFRACPLFAHIDHEVLTTVIATMPVERIPGGTRLIQQGDDGDCLYVLLKGTVEVYNDATQPRQHITTLPQGRIFGELAMLYNTPRKFTIYSSDGPPCEIAQLNRSVYQNVIVRHQMGVRERRESCLRRARCLETMNWEQIAHLADALETRVYQEGEAIVRQGDPGAEFFIVQSGQCVATVETGTVEGAIDVQEHRRYNEGDLFGERALLECCLRAATVTAVTRVEVLSLTRASFERMLGPLSLLQRQNYMTDPRKCISDFYRSGDKRGCRGCILDPNFDPVLVPPEQRTDWFAVYRPTSRDAIALMLSGEAVGKGLNVKGKSAKRGRFSGFVPFLQISQNAHKELIDKPKADARVRVFYTSETDRKFMLKTFEPLLSPEDGVHILGDRVIFYVDLYPGVYGLDIPEPVLHHVYLQSPDLSFQAGMDTGRKSEPAFMDMNSASLRSSSEPKVVLLQADKDDPKNPHGLLVAYAEKTVKPVVSDFDTFLVGSRNMDFDELPKEQAELQRWALEHAENILRTPGPGSWTTRWLEVIKVAARAGFHPKTPQFGFGDGTSYRMIKDAVLATRDTGAVRHGAECFNFLFPQELDEEYLIIWDGFVDKDWDYLDEDELRDFLIARAYDGYTFPLNPIWPIRDWGWDEVYTVLQSTEAGRLGFTKWFPDSAGIRSKVEELQIAYPDGFLAHGTGVGGISRKSMALDMDAGERANLAMGEITVGMIDAKMRPPDNMHEEDASANEVLAKPTVGKMRDTLRMTVKPDRPRRTDGVCIRDTLRPSSPGSREAVLSGLGGL